MLNSINHYLLILICLHTGTGCSGLSGFSGNNIPERGAHCYRILQSDIGSGRLTAIGSGEVTMPNFPGGLTQTADNTDWAVKLVLKT
jgi:hypothetical protein